MNNRKPYLVLGVLFTVIAILFGVRVVVSTRITTSGLALGEMQDEIAQYKTENTTLKQQIFALSSLSHVSEAASRVGFVESKSTFAVTAAHPIARGE
jgi:cell division protein FtsL